MYKILLTCPPMIESFHLYKEVLLEKNLDVHIPSFTQVMTENELIKIIGNYDGWIIGDDPATQKVFEHGSVSDPSGSPHLFEAQFLLVSIPTHPVSSL